MPVVTLISNPVAPACDIDTVSALRNAWGGGALRWLAQAEAVEFSVPTVPENRWEVWASLQERQIDLAVQGDGDRQKMMLIADMDSTMIQQECIDELAVEAGVGERVSEITARAMNGELDFDGALRARVELLKGLPVNVIGKVLDERIDLMPGGKVLLATMKAAGARAVLVSGGFTAFAGPIAETLGFDTFRANTLLSENGVLTGQVGLPILGRDAKVETLLRECEVLGIEPAQVLAVGDGANDLGMLGLAGMGVALHAKPSVAAACDLRINHGDLTALLYLQGFNRDQFYSNA